MDNHYHLVLRVGEHGLARGMCELNTACALNYNARHGRINHLFGKRYWNRCLRTDATVVNALRYVVQNPRRAGGTRPLEAYVWASYAATIGVASARHPPRPRPGAAVLRHEARARGRGVPRLLRRHCPSAAMSGGSHRDETRAPELRECVLGAAAAFGRGQAAALGGDGAALDAVRRGELHLDRAVAVRRRRPRRPAPGTCAPTAPPARAGPSSGCGCDSAGRRACGCPTRTRSTACRT